MLLPDEFVKSGKLLLGKDWDLFVEALDKETPVSIRINPGKYSGSGLTDRVPWCDTGFYLDKRPSFTFDPLFHAGVYYVQEASSMFVEQVFKQYLQGDIKVLDLCAAPGGKSTHIASLLSNNSLLVANEVIKNRAGVLAENLVKWGYPNVIVTNNDPKDFSALTDFFDAILIDAPCSGEGMFRKDPRALQEWSAANVRLCKERQQRIISDAWNALKPGGILIYSTCTFNREENEDNVLWVKDNFGADVLPVEINPGWNIATSYDKNIDCYHFFPYKEKGEGFFISVLKKSDKRPEQKELSVKKEKRESNKKQDKLASGYQEYIKNPADFIFFNKNNFWFAFPANRYSDFEKVSLHIRIVSGGIFVGEFKGKDFIPRHSLAMSVNLDRNSFMSHEIGWDNAIAYLKNEVISLPQMPKGYILLTYKSYPLGFVKNIGNRANNLYPGEWRIRSTYIPDIKTNTGLE